jgi:hypothetical protein
MKPSSLERALDAMESIMPGEPYALRPGDPKRKLIHELARISRELKIRPVVIGGLAVNHHGYLRVTVDVDLLLSKNDAALLHRRLDQDHTWNRRGEGYWNRDLMAKVIIHVKHGREITRTQFVNPLPVPTLEDLLALKTTADRAKDDGDIAELLKTRPARINSLHVATRSRLRTNRSRLHLDQVVARTKDELAQGR